MSRGSNVASVSLAWTIPSDLVSQWPIHEVQESLGPALDEVLEQRLASEGIGAHEIICIRTVSPPDLVAKLGDTPRSFAETWARAVATAAVEAIGGGSAGSDANVVRYRNRLAVLADAFCGAVLGTFQRSWAWRQASSWDVPDDSRSEGKVAEAAANLLLANPELAPMLVAEAVRRSSVDAVAAMLGPVRLSEVRREAQRARSSRWRRAHTIDHLGRGEVSSDRRQDTSVALVHELIDMAGADALVSVRSEPTAGQERSNAGVHGEREQSVGAFPAAGELSLRTRRGETPSVRVGRPTEAPSGLDRFTALDAVPGRDPAPRRSTEVAGLLFFVHLLDSVFDGPVAQACLERCIEAGGADATLHALGEALLLRCGMPTDAGDAALLAFAGRLPDAPTPHHDWTDSQRRDLEALSAELLAAAQRLLDRSRADRDELHGPDAAEIVRRRGVVTGDPGWIDVFLALDDVDLDVRRAGLDADPGYVRPLGCVIRFLYVERPDDAALSAGPDGHAGGGAS